MQDKSEYIVPALLVAVGVIGALYVLCQAFAPLGLDYFLGFAVFCFLGAVGWYELLEVERHNDQYRVKK